MKQNQESPHHSLEDKQTNQQSQPSCATQQNKLVSINQNPLISLLLGNENHNISSKVQTRNQNKISANQNQVIHKKGKQLSLKIEDQQIEVKVQQQQNDQPKASVLGSTKVLSKQKLKLKEEAKKSKLEKLWNHSKSKKAIPPPRSVSLDKQNIPTQNTMIIPQIVNNCMEIANTSVVVPQKKTTKPDISKIKSNISKVQSQSRLKVYTVTEEYLMDAVPFSRKQQDRLNLYFKHICERVYNFPKNTTFDQVKNLFSTINLTQWMIFCKQLGITEKFKEIKEGLKLLSLIFKKYEDTERRLDIEGFTMAVREVVSQILDNESKKESNGKSKEQIRQQIMTCLCIDSKRSHVRKLKEMGVMCSLQSYTIPKNLILQILQMSKKNKKQKQLARKALRNFAKSIVSSSKKLPDMSREEKSQKSQKSFPKIYKTSLERKQSQLMHRLAITNINKINPHQELKDSLGNFANNDRFLKDYFSKQEKIKEGIMNRLDKALTKHSYHFRI